MDQVQNQETRGKEIDVKNLDSIYENVETVLLVKDQVEGDMNDVKFLEEIEDVPRETIIYLFVSI